MHLLYTIAGLSITGGGPARSVAALTSALCELGQSNISLLIQPPDEGEQVLLHPDVKLTYASNDQWINSKGIKISPTDFDLIHANGLWMPFCHRVSMAAIANHTPIIITPRGCLEPWAFNHKWLKKRIAWWLYQRRDLKHATAFHATSQAEAENIRRLGFKQPIAVIPNGIILPEVSLDSVIGKGESGDHRADNTDQISAFQNRIALFLGRLHPIKNLPSLLKAWAAVKPDGWQLVIAGNDDHGHAKELVSLSRSLGIARSVIIQGPAYGAAKEALFQSTELFILPSHTENFGIVVAEALGYGLPVIASTGTPWQELETHNCGWWVEPTEASIEAGLNKALSTKNEELSEMGRRGRKLVEENYQWPGIAEKMLAFYDWILNGGDKPDFVV